MTVLKSRPGGRLRTRRSAPLPRPLPAFFRPRYELITAILPIDPLRVGFLMRVLSVGALGRLWPLFLRWIHDDDAGVNWRDIVNLVNRLGNRSRNHPLLDHG